jgi:hypothetical protein
VTEQQAPAAARRSRKRLVLPKIIAADDVAEDRAKIQETRKESTVQPTLGQFRKRDQKGTEKKAAESRTKFYDKFSKKWAFK